VTVGKKLKAPGPRKTKRPPEKWKALPPEDQDVVNLAARCKLVELSYAGGGICEEARRMLPRLQRALEYAPVLSFTFGVGTFTAILCAPTDTQYKRFINTMIGFATEEDGTIVVQGGRLVELD